MRRTTRERLEEAWKTGGGNEEEEESKDVCKEFARTEERGEERKDRAEEEENTDV